MPSLGLPAAMLCTMSGACWDITFPQVIKTIPKLGSNCVQMSTQCHVRNVLFLLLGFLN